LLLCQVNGHGDSKQVLVIDDHYDSAFTIKSCLESHFRQDTEGLESKSEFHPIQATVYVDPFLALKEFKPYYYDLLLVDINMPSINGYELVEKIIKLDLNIKICFMSAGEINIEAIREIRHPSRSFGCFIKNQLQVLIWSIECCRNCTRRSMQSVERATDYFHFHTVLIKLPLLASPSPLKKPSALFRKDSSPL
jgi:CheY-like chemotaxis protein